MYCLSDKQIDYILSDIRARGVEMESLQQHLLDHICCIIEQDLEEGGDFEAFYAAVIQTFYRSELREIEEETISLLTFKNYYTMKKIMITSGTLSVAVFLTGSLFKIMRWPGASMLLFLGVITMSFVFLPLVALLKARDTSSLRDKMVLTAGCLTGIFLSLATLFSVMHWPGGGGGGLWLTATGISIFVLIPLYFFTGIRNPETRVNTIVTTILLVGGTGLLFSLINLRPPLMHVQLKMYTYIQNEKLLKTMQQKAGSSSLVTAINADCEQIKGMILERGIGQPSIPEDFESRGLLLQEGNLGDEFYGQGKGVQLLSSLKAEIRQYNASARQKIPVEHSVAGTDVSRINAYSNLSVLNNLTQLQMLLATAESSRVAMK